MSESYFKLIYTDDNYIFDNYINTNFSDKFTIYKCESILDNKLKFHSKSLFDSRKKCYICSNTKDFDFIVEHIDDLVSGKFQNYNIIIFRLNVIDKRSKLYKKCKNLIIEPKLKVEDLCNNILNCNIDKELLNELYIKCGNNISKCAFELEKVKYLINSGYTINDAVVEVISIFKNVYADIDIFKYIDSIIYKDKDSILNYIKYINTSQFDFGFSTLLYNNFHNLYVVKNGGINATPDSTGLSQFIINSVKNNCKKYSIDRLNNILEILFNIDKDVKSGNLDSSYAYDLLLVRLLSCEN